MSSHLASRDDPNHFLFVHFSKGVHNQQKQNTPYQANRVPAFLTIHIPVRKHHKAGIVENQRCRLERYLVFPIVLLCFIRIPIKAHFHRLYVIVYT